MNPKASAGRRICNVFRETSPPDVGELSPDVSAHLSKDSEKKTLGHQNLLKDITEF
jgi:hypothetical protein